MLHCLKAKYSPLISKQKEIFDKFADERLEEITKLDKKKVNPDDLIYRYKSSNADEKFNEFGNAFILLDKIRDGKISLADAKNYQTEFKSNLSEIKKGNKKHRSKEQKYTLYNIEMLYKARNKVAEFFYDYSSMASETKLKATKETALKILTPKQMLQRLPIVPAQVRGSNNSQSLLNEIG